MEFWLQRYKNYKSFLWNKAVINLGKMLYWSSGTCTFLGALLGVSQERRCCNKERRSDLCHDACFPPVLGTRLEPAAPPPDPHFKSSQGWEWRRKHCSFSMNVSWNVKKHKRDMEASSQSKVSLTHRIRWVSAVLVNTVIQAQEGADQQAPRGWDAHLAPTCTGVWLPLLSVLFTRYQVCQGWNGPFSI